MSGDVQPRKRKDKKRKRESLDVRKSEGELIFSRKSSLQDDESSHGVHITKMGTDDVHLHIHEEHGTGGHWCAKIVFFSLMTILMGLVCLIILENRGTSNVDTPLSESRFSNYFDGWVDESRAEHDDHHDVHESLEHDDHGEVDEHENDDDHNEPFEEEVDHSEGDEDVAEEEDENLTPEEDEDDNATAENVTAEEANDEEEEEDDENNDTAEEDHVDNATTEETDDENITAEEENVTIEQNDDENDDDVDDDGNNTNEDDNITKETFHPMSEAVHNDDEDEEEDDGNFDSFENIVDNDAAELDLLREKARQQAAAEFKQDAPSVKTNTEDEPDNAPSWASSLAVKIGVGLALALVARLVLIRKNPNSNENPPPEVLINQRRLTIASPLEMIPDEVDQILPEDDYSGEEIEVEEEIEYIDENEEPVGEENQVDAGDNEYMPETFEQLNAMYRSKDREEKTDQELKTKLLKTESPLYSFPYNTSSVNNNLKFDKEELLGANSVNNSNKYKTQNSAIFRTVAPVFEAPPPPPLVSAIIEVQPNYTPPKEAATVMPDSLPKPIKKDVTYDMDYEKAVKAKSEVEHKNEVTYDMDHLPETDDVDYDEDDLDYDDEEQDDDSEDLDDEELLSDDEDVEEGDDEEVSDIDDAELMNRLEAKYGKLPANEYESDEDPDDPTWTQIKPNTDGGPQSLEDDELDLFEKELRSANEEMMREFNFH